MPRGLAVLALALITWVQGAGAALVDLPKPVPLTGETVGLIHQSSSASQGRWNLVVFGFSHCQDICPISLQNLGFLVKTAAKNNIALDGIFVTIDPDRDTEVVLAGFTKPLGKGVSYLRLEGEALERFKDQFSVEAVFYTKNSGNQQHYQVDHSSTAFLIDPEGRIRVVFDAVEDVKAAAEMLENKPERFRQ